MPDRRFITVRCWSSFEGRSEGTADVATDQIASVQSRTFGRGWDGATITLANGVTIDSADSVEKIRTLMEQANG